MACISLPTALLIGGGLSAAGGLASAVIGSGASTKAAELQSEAATQAAQVTKDQFAATTANLTPYMSAGVDAIPELKGLLGLPGGTGGGTGSSEISDTLKNLPGYQFQLQQGLQATQNGFAAQGLGQSGAALKGAANYAEGLAGTSYEQLFGNVLSSVGLGQSSASALAGFGANAASAENSLTTGGAAAQAAGVVGSANSIIGGLNTAVSGVNQAIVTPAMLQLLTKNSDTASALKDVNSIYGAPGGLPAGG